MHIVLFMQGKKRGEFMKPKLGRPKSTNPKSVNFTVRFDEQLNEKLENYCNNTGKTKSDVVREGVKLVIKKE